MSLAQSGPASPAPDTSERRQRMVIRTRLLACCAIMVSAAGEPALDAVARALTPYQSANDPAFSETVVNETRLHMWLIVIGSFLVIVALAVMAIRMGRRALRIGVNDTSLTLLELWAIGTLLGGMVIGLVPLLLTGRGGVLILSIDLTILLPSITLAGAVGGFILSGIAVRRTTPGLEQTAAWRTVLRVVARICLVLAPIIMLAGFILFSFYTQLIVAFYPVW